MLGVQMLSGYDDFNPRSPDGERPGISISVVPEALISIHAPRMGSDVYVPRLRFVSRDFNPRSPDGERPIGRPYPRSLIYFNPRSPDGERRKQDRAMGHPTYFNPRSPDGERPPVCSIRSRHVHFNPRSPDGERRFNVI